LLRGNERELSAVTQTRTWNLFIDVIAQTRAVCSRNSQCYWRQ